MPRMLVNILGSWMHLTPTEEKARQIYEALGYDVIHIGVPDFILLKDGHIEFVEIKTVNDSLSDAQKRTIGLLKAHHFPVRVEGPGGYLTPEMFEMPRAKEKDKPAFLTSREFQYILALKKHGGVRFLAARELGVKKNAIEKTLTRIRKKVETAYAFKRKYGKLIERRR